MSFKGTHYHGWQVQPNAITVQETVNKALYTLLGERISATGAGRTDTGVHARYFVAHFDSKNSNLDGDSKFLYKINSILPHDISIFALKKVKDNAHCRYDAISRTYEYFISRKKDPFTLDFSYPFFLSMDLKSMKKASNLLFEYRDFSCFSKGHTDVKTNICRLMNVEWNEIGETLVFTITADRFLRNMVRAIVGTMLEIGTGKITLDQLKEIIESKDRSKAGYSVPAQGLFLTDIVYPISVYE